MLSACRDPARLRVGIDLVRLSRIGESIERFGDRFGRRLLTDAEFEFVMSAPSLVIERMGTRFAAKEATLKALRLAHVGVNWKDIEVVAGDSGACELVLHGLPKTVADRSGIGALAVSLTHEGDYAMAVVMAQS